MNVLEACKDYGIEYLTHFTNVYNLKSILTYGLLSVNNMKNNNIKYFCSDNNRFDNALDYISVSTSIINKKMLYKKVQNNQNNLNIWVIFVLDINVLNDKLNDCCYCYQNAASKEISVVLKNNPGELNNEFYFRKFLGSNDEQKEILIKNKIDLKYIKAIVVKNYNDKDLINNILLSMGLNIPIVCKSAMF